MNNSSKSIGWNTATLDTIGKFSLSTLLALFVCGMVYIFSDRMVTAHEDLLQKMANNDDTTLALRKQFLETLESMHKDRMQTREAQNTALEEQNSILEKAVEMLNK